MAYSSSEYSSDDSSPPALIGRREAGENSDIDNDSSSSDDIPQLLARRRDNNSSSSDDGSSDDDSVPHLEEGPSEDSSKSSDDDVIPELLVRQDHTDSSDDDSSRQAVERRRQEELATGFHSFVGIIREEAERQAELYRREEAERERQEAQRHRREEADQLRREEEARRQKETERQRKAQKRKRNKAIKKIVRVWRQYQAVKLEKSSAIKIQSAVRRFTVRMLWAEPLNTQIKEMRRFQKMMWSRSFEAISKEPKLESWERIKERLFDTRRQFDSWALDEKENEQFKKDHEATNDVIDSAYQFMLDENSKPNNCEEAVLAVYNSSGDDEEELTIETMEVEERTRCDHIQLTKDVLKWFDRQDPHYRGIFLKRILQLANGYRSYVTKKHLTGCKNFIWESKLDKGMRILYTERNLNKDDYRILVYYVSKHDYVSRLIRLIDEAENRSRRQVIHSNKLAVASELYEENPHPLLPDPLGDTPLKVHMLERDDIPKMAKSHWKPRLVLTPEERDCVEKEGSVLLLGRSGTGKTVCIADRMEYDRQTFLAGRKDPTSTLDQLFVARSNRICLYVKGMVDGGEAPEQSFYQTTYLTFAQFLRILEDELDGHTRSFDPSEHVEFGKFYREFASQYNWELGPLIVWSQIRSFIKGSMEAVQADRDLSPEEYLGLGEKRCRLNQEQRKEAYSAYERYKSHFLVDNRWDDCDRIANLLRCIKRATRETLEKLSYHKIYVDEIQDYTQAEIALFFLLSRPDGLFFAGDTAQSVVEGVEFRFEEVRSVAYSLYRNDSDRRYIPNKPLMVNRNFRSHAGILNLAAAILDRLVEAFPAQKLKPDTGVFVGPRPGLLYSLDNEMLRELVRKMEGVVVLTHDGNDEDETGVARLSRIINDDNSPTTTMVLGFRESKGLEFPNVLIVDFFKGLPAEHQKSWRQLLSIRENRQHEGRVAPEVETQVKLLYTGITRCGKRLLFAETGQSIAGDAFSKWIDKLALGVRQAVKDIEALTRTADEWVSAGIDCALEAENSREDTAKASKWLKFALENLQNGDAPPQLLRKAEDHATSVKIREALEACYPVGSAHHQSMDVDEFEASASTVLHHLIGHGFFFEARKLAETLIPLLGDYSQKHLQKGLAKLLEIEEY